MRSLIARFFPSSCCTVTLKYIHNFKRLYLRNGMLDNFVPPHAPLFLVGRITKKKMHYTQDGHHILCSLFARGSKTIILFDWLGFGDGQNFLREFPILHHVSSFCTAGKKKRKSVDPNKNIRKTGKKLRHFCFCSSWLFKERDWHFSSSCTKIHFICLKFV